MLLGWKVIRRSNRGVRTPHTHTHTESVSLSESASAEHQSLLDMVGGHTSERFTL